MQRLFVHHAVHPTTGTPFSEITGRTHGKAVRGSKLYLERAGVVVKLNGTARMHTHIWLVCKDNGSGLFGDAFTQLVPAGEATFSGDAIPIPFEPFANHSSENISSSASFSPPLLLGDAGTEVSMDKLGFQLYGTDRQPLEVLGLALWFRVDK